MVKNTNWGTESRTDGATGAEDGSLTDAVVVKRDRPGAVGKTGGAARTWNHSTNGVKRPVLHATLAVWRSRSVRNRFLGKCTKIEDPAAWCHGGGGGGSGGGGSKRKHLMKLVLHAFVCHWCVLFFIISCLYFSTSRDVCELKTGSPVSAWMFRGKVGAVNRWLLSSSESNQPNWLLSGCLVRNDNDCVKKADRYCYLLCFFYIFHILLLLSL